MSDVIVFKLDVAVYRRTVYVRPPRRGSTYTARRTHVRAAAVDGCVLCAHGKVQIKNGLYACTGRRGGEKTGGRGGIVANTGFAVVVVPFTFFSVGDIKEEPAKSLFEVWRVLLCEVVRRERSV